MFPRILSAILGLAAAALAARADEPEAVLFNGKDFTGWVIDGATEAKDKATGKTEPIWSVRDGLIHCTGAAYGFLRYDRKYADFAFHVEYRIEPVPGKAGQGNSGIGIRTGTYDRKVRDSAPSVAAYEVQLLDDGGKEPSKHSTGSLYRYVAPTKIAVKKAGEWNAVDVECVGPRVRVTFNGELVLDVDQTTIPELKDKPLSGYVCLQSHSHGVDFRNVRIREIKK